MFTIWCSCEIHLCSCDYTSWYCLFDLIKGLNHWYRRKIFRIKKIQHYYSSLLDEPVVMVKYAWNVQRSNVVLNTINGRLLNTKKRHIHIHMVYLTSQLPLGVLKLAEDLISVQVGLAQFQFVIRLVFHFDKCNHIFITELVLILATLTRLRKRLLTQTCLHWQKPH